MQFLLIIAVLQHLISYTCATYSLEQGYEASSFTDYFDFFTGNDPAKGYVDYVDMDTAFEKWMVYQLQDSSDGRQLYIGVDHSNVSTGRGRRSIRLESKKSYNHGLFILDLDHMPNNACGSWPAFWMLSTSKPWPQGGEIDIIEGINMQHGNSMALHTEDGCKIQNTTEMSGYVHTANCDIRAEGQGYKESCTIKSSDEKTYGSGFNDKGGGVYATEWTKDHISIWHFAKEDIPSDIVARSYRMGYTFGQISR